LEIRDLAVIACPFQLQTTFLHQQQRDDVTQLLLGRIGVFEHPLEVFQQGIRIERFGFLELSLRHGATPVGDHAFWWPLPTVCAIVGAARLRVLIGQGRMHGGPRLEQRPRGATGLVDGVEAIIHWPVWGWVGTTRMAHLWGSEASPKAEYAT